MTDKIARSGRKWRNWSGLAQAKPRQVLAPASASEVSAAVLKAGESGRTVRMVGAGHSFSDTAVADDILMLPRRLNGVRSVDNAAGRITVEAGIDLTTLCAVLDDHKLALTNMGDIRVQTIAGAIATGTHGTGRASGTFANMVTELEMVTGDGQIVTVNREQDPELFNSARVGLGAFGIVTAVTLAVEPAFQLRAHEHAATFDETIRNFDRWTAEHDHFEFFWFPHTEGCLLKHNDRTDEPAAPVGKLKAWWEDQFLSNTVFGAMCRFSRAAPGYTPLLNKIASKVLSDRTFVDKSWRVFTSERDVRFAEMEYNLPREALLPALKEVKELLDNGPWRISFPLEVRSIPGDDAWLSPATERASGYIACHAFQRTDRDWFVNVETIMKAHDGRPHWGKLHTRTAPDLATAYPNWQRALDVRNRVDPNRTFANDYTRRVLGD